MTVYVDDMYRFEEGEVYRGRLLMKVSRMTADTEAELHAMAQLIGIHRRHFRDGHYDVCKQRRGVAVGLGAVEITMRLSAQMLAKRRRA